MKKQNKIYLGIGIVAIILIAAIMIFSAPKGKKTTNTIKIGAIWPMTGPASFLGESNSIGANLALEKINENGGINGKKLELIVEDSQTNPTNAVNAYNGIKLKGGNIQVIFTTLTSIAKVVQPISEKDKILLLSESSDPSLTKNYEYTFRNFYTTDDSNDVLLEYLRDNNFSKIAMIYMNDDFGNSAKEDLENKILNENIKIVSAEAFDNSQTDFKTSLTKIKEKNPEVVYIVGFGSSLINIYKQSYQLKLNAKKVGFIICGQGNVLEGAKDYLNGTFGIEPKIDTKNQEYQKLIREFEIQHSQRKIDQNVVLWYDTVNMVAEAMEKQKTSGTEIKEYLKGKTHEGLLGIVKFDETGDSKREMILKQIENGTCYPVN